MTRPSSDPGYVQDVIARLGDRHPLEVFSVTPAWIEARVIGLDDAILRRPEAPGKWSVIEVVQHLADTEVVFAWRTRVVLEQDNPPIHGFDENRWAELFHYRDADLGAALRQFRALREANLRLWRTLTPTDLARAGVHSERGPETLDLMMRLWAGHDIVHRGQIERVLGAVRHPSSAAPEEAG
ncbi:MAG: DinB family protein [Gemmatimonadota bacterium]